MRQAHALIIVIMMMAAGLACTLSDNTNANSEALNRPTVFVPPTATITPTPEADTNDEETDESSNNGSNSGNSGQNSGSSGNSGNSDGGVIVGCSPRTDWFVYRVVSGDTLGLIAQRTGSTVNALSTANCLANANAISVGQALYVPRNPIPTITPPPQQDRVGYVAPSHYIFGDAGFYMLQAGKTITLSYPDMTAVTAMVDFVYVSVDGTQTVIGRDTNMGDGATQSWTIPEFVSGGVEAVALRTDLTVIHRSFKIGISSAHSLPSDRCVAQAESIAEISLWYQPTTAGQSRWGVLASGRFIDVVGTTADGWVATMSEYSPANVAASGIYRLKWIEPIGGYAFYGPCDDLPEILIDVSSTGCYVGGTPAGDVSYYDVPNIYATVAGSLTVDSSFEILGKTSDGWYGIDTGSTDGVGAYRLKWLRSDANLTLSPACGSLPTIY